jgi:hypothetical protein
MLTTWTTTADLLLLFHLRSILLFIPHVHLCCHHLLFPHLAYPLPQYRCLITRVIPVLLLCSLHPPSPVVNVSGFPPSSSLPSTSPHNIRDQNNSSVVKFLPSHLISEDSLSDNPCELYDMLDDYYDSFNNDQDSLMLPNKLPHESPLVGQQGVSTIGTPV